MRSSTETIIKALRILAADIQSGDGVANAAIAEAADRLEELSQDNVKAEPLAYYCKNDPERETAFHWKPITHCPECGEKLNPVYAKPPTRNPLTDDEIIKIVMNWPDDEEMNLLEFARAIESALGVN